MGSEQRTNERTSWHRRALPERMAAVSTGGELLMHRSQAATLGLGGVALVETDRERRTLSVRSPSGGPWDKPHRLVMCRWYKGRVVLNVHSALAELGLAPAQAAGKYRVRLVNGAAIVDLRAPAEAAKRRPAAGGR